MLTERGFKVWEETKIKALSARNAGLYYKACMLLEIEPEALDLFEQGQLEDLLSQQSNGLPRSLGQSYFPSSYRSTEYGPR